MRSRLLRRSTFISALMIFIGLLSLDPSWLSNEGTTSAQDPSATLPTPKKTTPAEKTTPPKRKTPAPRHSSCSAQSPTQGTGRTHTTNLGAGVTMDLVEIGAGSFCMGSNAREAIEDEKPVHKVTINYSFYMAKFEVTQSQWQAVTGNNPSIFKECGGNCPVENVSWDDAHNFISKLNQSNDGFRYRLPAEAEWEYACRAGTTEDKWGTILDTMTWYDKNSGKRTHPVGQKQPNAWGLTDMHGNVREWCEDWYHETYNGAPKDGSAWVTGGEQKERVLRSGSFFDWVYVASSSDRNRRPPDYRDSTIGFRLVATARAQ